MTSGLSVVVALLLSLGWMVPAARQPPAGSAFTQENTPDNLQDLMRHVFRTIHIDKSIKESAALLRALVPDERRARLALKDDIEPETLKKVVEFHKGFGTRPDEEVAKWAEPELTMVNVHGSTTEQLKANRERTVASQEFPGGARQMAERVLRPGMTFYEVEFVKPGETTGVKYHLFYWDGQQWSMMGPIWRVVTAPDGKP